MIEIGKLYRVQTGYGIVGYNNGEGLIIKENEIIMPIGFEKEATGFILNLLYQDKVYQFFTVYRETCENLFVPIKRG